MKPTPQKKLIAGMSLIAALAVAGCTGEPETEPTTTAPTTTRPAIPTEEPTPEPTANVSANAESPDEAIAAATAAYEEFSDTKWAIFNDGGENPERIYNLATLPAGGIVETAFEMRTNGTKITGTSTFEIVQTLVSALPVTNGVDFGPNSQVVLTGCADSSALKNIAADGSESPRQGPKRVLLDVTVQWTPEANRWTVYSEDVTAAEDSSC